MRKAFTLIFAAALLLVLGAALKLVTNYFVRVTAKTKPSGERMEEAIEALETALVKYRRFPEADNYTLKPAGVGENLAYYFRDMLYLPAGGPTGIYLCSVEPNHKDAPVYPTRVNLIYCEEGVTDTGCLGDKIKYAVEDLAVVAAYDKEKLNVKVLDNTLYVPKGSANEIGYLDFNELYYKAGCAERLREPLVERRFSIRHPNMNYPDTNFANGTLTRDRSKDRTYFVTALSENQRSSLTRYDNCVTMTDRNMNMAGVYTGYDVRNSFYSHGNGLYNLFAEISHNCYGKYLGLCSVTETNWMWAKAYPTFCTASKVDLPVNRYGIKYEEERCCIDNVEGRFERYGKLSVQEAVPFTQRIFYGQLPVSNCTVMPRGTRCPENAALWKKFNERHRTGADIFPDPYIYLDRRALDTYFPGFSVPSANYDESIQAGRLNFDAHLYFKWGNVRYKYVQKATVTAIDSNTHYLWLPEAEGHNY